MMKFKNKLSCQKSKKKRGAFPLPRKQRMPESPALIYSSNFKYLRSSGTATGMVVFLTVNKSKILCVNIGMKPLRRLQHATQQRVPMKKGLVIQDNCDH